MHHIQNGYKIPFIQFLEVLISISKSSIFLFPMRDLKESNIHWDNIPAKHEHGPIERDLVPYCDP